MAEPFLETNLRIAPIDAFIDPPAPRERAIVTHGHADHARPGHGAVLATPETIAIMKARYGEAAARRWDPLPYGETRVVDGVRISLHPAGHILGSAQVRLEWKGRRIVVTGDYKRFSVGTNPPPKRPPSKRCGSSSKLPDSGPSRLECDPRPVADPLTKPPQTTNLSTRSAT